MSGAGHAVDSRTAQRLRARRLLVVDADRERAETLAGALCGSGAEAVAVTPADPDHAAAHAIDADVMLVNEDEPDACRPLVIALRRHPRTRWTTVMPVSFASLWQDDRDQLAIAALADEVSRRTIGLTEMTVRARGKLPHHAALEPIGPSRLLRALDNSRRKLRVTLSDGRIRGELDLIEGRVASARVVVLDSNRQLVDVQALAAILVMNTGHLRIDERAEGGKASWNAALVSALDQAAVLACAANGEQPPVPASSGVRPAVTERLASALPSTSPAPAAHMKPTVPQISVSEALAEAAAMGFDGDLASTATAVHADRAEQASGSRAAAASEELPVVDTDVALASGEQLVDQEQLGERSVAREQPAAGQPSDHPQASARSPRVSRRGARGFVAVLGFALVAVSVAGVLFVGSRPQTSAALPRASVARPQPELPAPAASAVQSPAIAPQATAPVAPEPAGAASAAPAPAARPPTRSELRHARRIVKRGDRYLHDDRSETAAMAYQKALAIAPDYVPAITPLVQIYLRRGNAAEARRWAEHLAELEPDSAMSQLLLGDARAASGDDAGASEAWRRASALGSPTARKRLAPRR